MINRIGAGEGHASAAPGASDRQTLSVGRVSLDEVARRSDVTALSTDFASHTKLHQARRIDLWQAVAAMPAVAVSALLLLVMIGRMNHWPVLVLLGWLAPAVAVWTRPGERIAVRVGLGFRRPTDAQAARLDQPWSRAMRCCGTDPQRVEIYVQNRSDCNAFAVGRRSIAVTTAAVGQHRSQGLTDGQLVALLVHELGHHAIGAARLGLVIAWLTLPCRTLGRLLVGIAIALGRRQPMILLAAVVVAGFTAAIVQSLQKGDWAAALLLGAVPAATVLCPVADAALSRRHELAADHYAAVAGLAPELISALRLLDVRRESKYGLTSRLLAHHPDTPRRIAALSEVEGTRAASTSLLKPC
jgi:STE24 endopeptidase